LAPGLFGLEWGVANVLIVEDDEPFAYLVEKGLNAEGHVVSLFHDWSGVLDLLEGDAPIDLLITDLKLPAGTPNGVSLARLAIKRRPGLKVVYMTAFADLAVEVSHSLPNLVIKGADARAVLTAVGEALAA